MNDDQYSAFLAVLVPEVVGLVARRQNLGEPDAAQQFYASKLYAKLADEKLKLWHYSPETLYSLYESERNGQPQQFPEEAA